MERTNIEERLEKTREKDIHEMLARVKAFLNEDRCGSMSAPGNNNALPVNSFDFDALETSRIYHLDHIRKICIDYRLRFLDLKYFKGQLPAEGEEEIKSIEGVHSTRLENLKILAPSRMFKLEDKDDPLLFVPMGNNHYYLIHKWGNDLHPLRKLMVWPFKNIINLTLVLVFISYLLTLFVPDGLFSKSGGSAEFFIIFFFMFKSLAAVTIFYGFALGKNFNPAIWNSKYFNA